MKTFTIAAETKDGFIARNNSQNSMNWTSEEDKKFFIEKTKEAGVVIMGRKTFDTFKRPLKDRRNIVLTRQDIQIEGVEVTSESPEDLLNRLEKEGVEEVAILGGAEIYKIFIEKGLVDKIYLTQENVEFGEGVPFLPPELRQKLQLVSSTNLSPNTLLLEYVYSD